MYNKLKLLYNIVKYYYYPKHIIYDFVLTKKNLQIALSATMIAYRRYKTKKLVIKNDYF